MKSLVLYLILPSEAICYRKKIQGEIPKKRIAGQPPLLKSKPTSKDSVIQGILHWKQLIVLHGARNSFFSPLNLKQKCLSVLVNFAFQYDYF